MLLAYEIYMRTGQLDVASRYLPLLYNYTQAPCLSPTTQLIDFTRVFFGCCVFRQPPRPGPNVQRLPGRCVVRPVAWHSGRH